MLLKNNFPSLLRGNSHAMHRLILRTDQDQIFDDEIHDKCCVKDLLGFLNNNIEKLSIDERWNYLQRILLYWITENSDYFKNEKK